MTGLSAAIEATTSVQRAAVPPSDAAAPAPDPAAAPPAATAKPAKPAPPGSPLYVGGFGSRHPGVCNVAFGDGSVRAMSANTASKVIEQLGHRNDGSLHDDSVF
jgi:prepilin-type processing-associated H-X9-DG protein